ncbi:MAG: DUF3696 domain-containing protein [Nitrospirae bacterium]|nr:DUF3696 domain-containing protein [Nitrospirota bacterium]
MIKLLELINFKSIKTHRFHLRNLNVALGLNGMGKSTFIQGLLLLRQSDNLNQGELKLNGTHVDIGKGKDAFYQYSKEDKLIFEIVFTNNVSKRFNFVYNSEADYFKTEKSEPIGSSFFNQALFSNSFQYLSASRTDPKTIHDKSYTSVINHRNIGDKGQFTGHFLNVYGDNDIKFVNLKHAKSNSLQLLEQVNKWMGEISPGVKFNVTDIPNSEYILLDMQFEQPSLGFTNKFKPANVGFGISYSLPVVTVLLAAQPGDLIIIENPESHVHPRGQAELGKLIALTAMNDVQVIIETHSDHVLNGIRVATKEKNITNDKEILFYFEKKLEAEEQYSKITDIEVDRNGELSTYPANLLDEWSNQLMKLV